MHYAETRGNGKDSFISPAPCQHFTGRMIFFTKKVDPEGFCGRLDIRIIKRDGKLNDPLIFIAGDRTFPLQIMELHRLADSARKNNAVIAPSCPVHDILRKDFRILRVSQIDLHAVIHPHGTVIFRCRLFPCQILQIGLVADECDIQIFRITCRQNAGRVHIRKFRVVLNQLRNYGGCLPRGIIQTDSCCKYY